MVLTTFPGTITFEVENASTVPPTTTRYGPATISKYFRQHVMITEGGQTHFTTQSYMVDGLTMDPGEVIVLSPKSGRDPNRANEFHDELFPGTNTDNASGAILSSIPLITVVPDDPATLDVDESYESTTWGKVRLNLANDTVRYLYCTKYWGQAAGEYRETNMAEHNWTHTSMPSSGTLPKNAWQDGSRGEHLQQLGGNGAGDRNQPFKEYFVPTSWGENDGTLPPWTGSAAASTLVDTKTWFGINANLLKPAAHERTLYANPVEMFTQFNPARMAGYSDMHRPCLPNECYTLVSGPGDTEGLLQAAGIAWPASELENGFFGQNYTGSGPSPTTHIAMSNIPSSPLISLAAFNHANFGVGYWHPFHSVGNSWASVHVSPTSPYGPRPAPGHTGTATAHDANWMLNDALFDRYFFSGIVPEYTIGSGGYNATGSLSETLRRFYGIDPDAPTQTVDPDTAQASPVLQAYVPAGKTSEGVVDELLETSLDDTANETPGYKKMAAYSMLKGGFNINCTDANAWGRFMRGSNGDLSVKSSDGTTDPRTEGWFGFPSSPSPSPAANTAKYQIWSGWSRLRGGSATGDLWAEKGLATHIPPQIMERAPFMSVSNFVNHKVGGTSVTDHHKSGAIQAAADKMNVNVSLRSGATGLTADYSDTTYFADDAGSLPNRNSTNGIPGAVTQANILLPLAPRLTVRSDTFRIRGYGEVTDADGNIIAKATCEAVVQRLPEYVDTETDPANNEPWDEGDILNATNKLYGRRFEIRSFRWLDESEI